MTKREEYLAAKKLAHDLKERVVALHNELYKIEQEAQKEADPEREIWLKARDRAVQAARFVHREKIGELEILRQELANADRKFNEMHYDCNHKQNDGSLALKPHYSFGSDPGDKMMFKCEICEEKWV